MIKVEGHSQLYRDEKTGAIINKMREDIDELKGLLRQLLEKKD